MILSKTVKVKLWSHNIKYLLSLGYEGKMGDIIDIKIEHLSKGSRTKIEVLCDMCKQNKMIVEYGVYNRVVKKTGSYVCRQCSYEKTAQTNLKRYGSRIASQTESIKEKMKQTNLELYGVDNYGKTKECHDKIKQTCLEKYGVEHFAQLQEVKDKKLNTNLERYGVKYIMQVEEFRNKQKETLFEHYGVDSPMKSPIIKEKLSKALYKNRTKKSSKQQRYINNLYNGELNYPIDSYSADICFPKEKLIVEYDGSGHYLNVKFGNITEEEYVQKEIIRFSIIKRKGYKQMRIISSKDLLPFDETLFQMLSIAREYFNTSFHSWINFDIDNSKIINAENKDTDGIFFNYGELRKIKESDFINVA